MKNQYRQNMSKEDKLKKQRIHERIPQIMQKKSILRCVQE